MNICRSKDGHVKLWYKIIDSDISQDNNAFVVFTRMLFYAHYESDFTSIRFGGKQYKLQAGEFSATLSELSALVHIPQSTLRRVLERLEADGRISRRSDRQITIYTICNWGEYQGDQRGKSNRGKAKAPANEKNRGQQIANENAIFDDKPANEIPSNNRDENVKATNEWANEVANDMANDMANVTEGKKNIKNIKNIDTNVSMAIAKTPSADINEMFEQWKTINGYAIDGQQQKNRFACSNLLKKYGKDGLIQMIRGVSLAQQDKFAPRISDFASLQFKQNDLIAWGKTKKISAMKKVVIV